MNPAEDFRRHLDTIRQISRDVCRRLYLSGDECDDFTSSVYFKLIKDDYAVLRKRQGRSSLATYLYAVIRNHGRDYLIKKKGKWRASQGAKWMGETAVELEVLLYRDLHTFEEAVQILHSRGCQESEQELEKMAANLPVRQNRRFEMGEDAIRHRPSAMPAADMIMIEKEAQSQLREAVSILEELVGQLEIVDRTIVKTVREGLKLAHVATSLGLKQKEVYRRKKRLFKQLRQQLKKRGVSREVLFDLFKYSK